MPEKTVMTLQRGSNGHLICGLHPETKPIDNEPCCGRCHQQAPRPDKGWCDACCADHRRKCNAARRRPTR